jgi:class 3 adenylate cyclase
MRRMSFDPDEQLKGNEARLWRLIGERAKAGADVEHLDERIWDLFGEDWAILYTELAGFSRHIATLGIHFLQIIHEQRRILLPIADRHDGILIRMDADSLLLIFRRVATAIACAVEMQYASQISNVSRSAEDQLLPTVGVGYGRVLRVGDREIFGKEASAARTLGEERAKANEILITQAARWAAGEMRGVRFRDLGLSVPGSDRNYRLIYQDGE